MHQINVCSTNPTMLDVELPSLPCLVESPSVSTFVPEEEDSVRPLLLLNTNGQTTTSLNSFIHPLMPCMDPNNKCNEDGKDKSSSSSDSSYGIGINMSDNAAATLFNKNTYKHLQHHSKTDENSNGHTINGNLTEGKNLPSFVSWNWPLIRKCTFYFFLSSLLAMCAMVVAMIITLPKTCNPKTAWYHGNTFYEIFPASFQDSNNDGIGDLRGLLYRIDYLKSLGISAVRLNSIFPSSNYPDDFENVTNLMDIAPVLGNMNDMHKLIEILHAHNISIILDLPLYSLATKTDNNDDINFKRIMLNNSYTASNNNMIINSADNIYNVGYKAIQYWLQNGIDGFYIKGLEYMNNLEHLAVHFAEWKKVLGPQRIIILSEEPLKLLSTTERQAILESVDLVDVYLDIFENSTDEIINHLNYILNADLNPSDSPIWIHWSLGGVNRPRITRHQNGGNITLMATILQLMLPGTPSIFYGDEIALQISNPSDMGLHEQNETKHLHHLPVMQWSLNSIQQHQQQQKQTQMQMQHFTDSKTLPWLPKSAALANHHFQYIVRMIKLRDSSPSLYKNAICKTEAILSNTIIRHGYKNILIIERFYPRRNSFISITNFNEKSMTLDISSIYYSGIIMLNDFASDKIYFSHLTVNPHQTIVVRLDK